MLAALQLLTTLAQAGKAGAAAAAPGMPLLCCSESQDPSDTASWHAAAAKADHTDSNVHSILMASGFCAMFSSW